MSEVVTIKPNVRESLVHEKFELTRRISDLAIRQTMLVNLMAETEEESERAANRISDINEFLRGVYE